MLKDYFLIAVGSLAKRRVRSYLTMIGIFIGIATVVALIGLGEGLKTAITGQFGSLGSDVLSVQAGGIQAGPPGTGVIDPLTTDDLRPIENVNGVKMVIPRLIRAGSMEFNDKSSIVYTGSVVGGDARKEIERVLDLKVEEGRNLKDSDTYKVVIGANFLDEDNWGKPIVIGENVDIEGQSFEVIGILKKKGSFIFDNIVLMNEDIMRDVFKDQKKVDIIAVLVENQDEIDIVKERIEKVMRKQRGVKEGEEDFEVQTPQAALGTVNDTLFAVQLFVTLIAAISLVVGGIGITNTMYTSVLERTRDIGVMKSIGATNRAIFIMFFIESGLLGLVGGIIGVILGVGLASGLAFAGKTALGSDLIQVTFSWTLLAGSLLFSFVLGSIAGITPAIGASRLHPVDALRYQK